ncbi:hypothetical protein [Mycobacterium noviomagense]|uniref:Transmembrane protein n=1 Tax=Mycobacterium noviomagense TaxID=459858 RepID=A0A7I7PEJ8_9MYCO|nr:hypothetical protein [Mycobacterium noviomagense]ORB11127.1 hypothetical protein BST37_20885 [Mycobacterium noviomagense]BBY06990.1 hypothetical protein MNVI_23080 [Mycobacterium noviomagense]
MTGPQESSNTRPISVAELLAKNGTIGAPPPAGRRRRRRHNSAAVTVAELTGEIPVVRDEHRHDEAEPTTGALRTEAANPVAEPVPDKQDEDRSSAPYWSEPEPRWPESPPLSPPDSGPERGHYPRPLRKAGRVDAAHEGAETHSGAERMSPDPLDDYAEIPVDVMDTEVREAEPATEDSAYVRSYLHGADGLPGGKTIDEDTGSAELLDTDELDEDYADISDLAEADKHAEPAYAWTNKTEALLHGGLVVFQSILAVAFGAGLFIAFDQLWRWNNIVALVLSVLVILGLVVGVRVVRKTEDIGSTLIAVAVGALVTLGPLALLQSG